MCKYLQMRCPFIVTLFSLIILAQTALAKSGNVIGKITENGSPVVGANVALLKTDGKTLVKADIANDKGEFVFENIVDGTYVLNVSMIGFEAYSSDSLILSGSNITIPEIKLERKSNTLKEVALKAQKPLIEVKADKIVVNVENSIVNAVEIFGRTTHLQYRPIITIPKHLPLNVKQEKYRLV